MTLHGKCFYTCTPSSEAASSKKYREECHGFRSSEPKCSHTQRLVGAVKNFNNKKKMSKSYRPAEALGEIEEHE